jgi:hypothetical protein
METRRKQEEVERLRLEEEDRRAALMLQAELEKEAQEDSQYRQLLEQERRDHELALRLAQESNGQIDESPTMSRKYVQLNASHFQVFSLSLPPPEKKRRKKLFFVQKAKFTFRLESRIGVETPQTELMIAVHKKEMFNRIGDLEMLKFFPFSSSSGTPDMALSNHNRLIRFVALFQTEKIRKNVFSACC